MLNVLNALSQSIDDNPIVWAVGMGFALVIIVCGGVMVIGNVGHQLTGGSDNDGREAEYSSSKV